MILPEMGFILDDIRMDRGESLFIYSFDYSSNTSVVNTLKRQYGISQTPSVVVNGRAIGGFSEKEVIVAYLDM